MLNSRFIVLFIVITHKSNTETRVSYEIIWLTNNYPIYLFKNIPKSAQEWNMIL